MTKTFKIPVVYSSWGTVEVEADTLEEACEKAMAGSLPKNAEYIDDSFGIDRAGIDESQDPDNNLDALPEETWK